jgi:flagellar biosynthesis/type III secretory pathway chaperone
MRYEAKYLDRLEEGERLCSRLRELTLEKHRLLSAGWAGEEWVLALEKLQGEEMALLSQLKDLFESTSFMDLADAAPEWAERCFCFFAAVKELKQLNQQNAAVLHDLHEYVSSTLAVLEKSSEELIYQDTGKQGEVKKVISRKNYFDHQV